MANLDTRYYRIGDFGISVEGPAFQESEYLSPFRTERLHPDFSVCVEVTDTLLPDEKIGSRTGWITIGENGYLIDERDHSIAAKIRYDSQNQVRILINRNKLECYGSGFLLRVFQLPSVLLKRGELFLHSSYIEINGDAILFTAKSQTGKSTQASLWEKYRGAFVVNGDRSLLRKENGVWLACGSPYCGTSKICHNRTLPIRAIVILSQAETNTVRRADVKTSLAAILSGGAFQTSDLTEVDAVTRIAGDLIACIPFYSLACTPDVRALEELEKIL